MASLREDVSNQFADDMTSETFKTLLIPGLPDDLAMLCLIRLPRRYHYILQGVCRRWRAFLKSQQFVALRKRFGLSEGWVYVLSRDSSEYLHWHVLDPAQRRWMSLPEMPAVCSRRFGMACEVLDGELYMIGGCGEFEDPTNEVHVFDPLQHRWKEAASMYLPRCYCVSGALHGKLYAIGGTGLTFGALNSLEMYDPHTNRWVCYDDPNVVPDLGESLVMDGKIYVRHVCPANAVSFYAAVYDPVKNIWSTLDTDMTRGWDGPAVVVGDDTYMLDQTFGVKLLALDKVNKCWRPLARFSPLSIRTRCRMAVVGSNLFVIGRGLKTLVLDIEKAWKMPGLLVTSSVVGLQSSDDVIVSCSTIYI